jgi:hypothetical protein
MQNFTRLYKLYNTLLTQLYKHLQNIYNTLQHSTHLYIFYQIVQHIDKTYQQIYKTLQH